MMGLDTSTRDYWLNYYFIRAMAQAWGDGESLRFEPIEDEL